MKKYKLTDESITYNIHKLYRIKALKNFSNVKAGDLGGYIESTSNLSQKGDAWVYNNAMVYDNAKVFGNAKVYWEARVFNNAKVCGNAIVCWEARVFNNAKVFGNAKVCGNAIVYGNAKVYNNANVYGNATVYGNAKVYRNANIFGLAQVFGYTEATGLVQHVVTFTHDITMTDKHIAIGCENHTFKYWKENIEAMGKKYKYSNKEIKAIRYILNGMLMMKKAQKEIK